MSQAFAQPSLFDQQKMSRDDMRERLLTVMLNHRGRARAITLENIRQVHFPWLKDHRSIRDLVRELRRNNHPICAIGGVGHFYPASREEVNECVEVEMRAKARDQLLTARLMRESAIRMFGGQQELG